jgi:hypothetical protein
MKYLAIVLCLVVVGCCSGNKQKEEVLQLPNCEKLVVPTNMESILREYYLSRPFGPNDTSQTYTFYNCYGYSIKDCNIRKIKEVCDREAIQ